MITRRTFLKSGIIMRSLCTGGELNGVRFCYRHPGMPDDAVADNKARIE